MNMEMIGIIIFILVLITISSLSILAIIRAYGRSLSLKRQLLETDIELKKLSMDNDVRRVKFNNDILDLIERIIHQNSLMKFRAFKDNHDGTKVNKEITINLVRDICELTNRSIKSDLVIIDTVYFTEEFYNNFIIDTCSTIVKELMNNLIESIEEEG